MFKFESDLALKKIKEATNELIQGENQSMGLQNLMKT